MKPLLVTNPLIDKYLQRGFGSMNKKDFEVLVFHELLQNDIKGWSDYDISVALKISPAAVHRLRYLEMLCYGDVNDPLRNKKEFTEAISKARYEDDKVVFRIESIALRQYIENKLNKQGYFADSSFKADILRIQHKDFVALLEEIYFDDEAIRTSIIESAKAYTKEEKPIKDILTDIVKGACVKALGDQLGTALGDLGEKGVDSIKVVYEKVYEKIEKK